MLVPVSPRFPIVHNSTANRFGVVSPAFDIKYVASWGFDQSCLLATWENPRDIHLLLIFHLSDWHRQTLPPSPLSRHTRMSTSRAGLLLVKVILGWLGLQPNALKIFAYYLCSVSRNFSEAPFLLFNFGSRKSSSRRWGTGKRSHALNVVFGLWIMETLLCGWLTSTQSDRGHLWAPSFKMLSIPLLPDTVLNSFRFSSCSLSK